MTLFCLLCVCLLLVGLAACSEVRARLGELWPRWLEAYLPVQRAQYGPVLAVSPRSPPHHCSPPPRVIPRAGPGV